MKGTNVQTKESSGTTILRCNCDNAYQDAKYGPGMRVFNQKANKSSGAANCTVCGRKA